MKIYESAYFVYIFFKKKEKKKEEEVNLHISSLQMQYAERAFLVYVCEASCVCLGLSNGFDFMIRNQYNPFVCNFRKLDVQGNGRSVEDMTCPLADSS